MCRNIKLLFHLQPPATKDEIHASSLQYVRKVSGPGQPTAANKAAFDQAVAEITAITERLLLSELQAKGPPRDRETERERAMARGQDREAGIRKKILAGT